MNKYSNKSQVIILPSNSAGGAEKVMVNLVNYAHLKDIKVYLIQFSKKNKYYKIHPSISTIIFNYGLDRPFQIIKLLYLFVWLRSHLKRITPKSIRCFGGNSILFFLPVEEFTLRDVVFFRNEKINSICIGRLRNNVFRDFSSRLSKYFFLDRTCFSNYLS